MIWMVLLLLLALLGSAMFAGSETGFYGLNRLRLRQMADDSLPAAVLVRITASSSGFLAALLLGNNLANSLAVQGGVGVLEGFGVDQAEFWTTIALTPVLLLLGELLPKAWMLQRPVRLVFLALPLAFFRVLFLPLTLPLAWLASRLEGSGAGLALERRQLETLLHEGREQAPGEARVMVAALRALDSRGQGLAPFLRHDLPTLPASLDHETARARLAQSPDGNALVELKSGQYGLLRSRNLLDAPAQQPLSALAVALPVLPRGLDLGGALVRLRGLGAAFAVVEGEAATAVLDLEYAVALLVMPTPLAASALDTPS